MILVSALALLGTGPGTETAIPEQAVKPEAVVTDPEAPESTAKGFALDDQYGERHDYTFPRTKAGVLLVADKKGSKLVEGWVVPLHERYAERIDIDGVADVRGVPVPMRGIVRFFFKRNVERPIMLDWDGTVSNAYACVAETVNVIVVSDEGVIAHRCLGAATPESIDAVCETVDKLLEPVTHEKSANTSIP
jgi:hypothetical protein